jgi:UDP-N-acetylmuramate-alanine ligase
LLPCEHVIFSEIFSDREVDPGTISSSMLAEAINKQGGHAEYYADKKDILERLNSLVGKDDLVLFLGPEDIRSLADSLKLD